MRCKQLRRQLCERLASVYEELGIRKKNVFPLSALVILLSGFYTDFLGAIIQYFIMQEVSFQLRKVSYERFYPDCVVSRTVFLEAGRTRVKKFRQRRY